MAKKKIASFFAGVGGIDMGFSEAGDFKTVYANEFDDYAADTFSENFNVEVDRRDITTVSTTDIPDFDVLLGGFPCQAFSIAGYRQGFDDEQGRGNLFFELVRIIKDKKPRVAFFENVKNLVSHDKGNTFRVICSELDRLGYKYLFQVLNASEYGNVPQNRERIYIVAFRDVEDYANFSFPKSVPLTKTIHDVIDFDSTDLDNAFYYSETKNVFYSELEENMHSHDSVYQWRRKYVRENKSHVVPTLTANMGTGGHNVPLIFTTDSRIRKLTPRECFNVQGFPADYKLPNQSNARLYKQAGNSVCVPVIERIAEQIDKALKETDSKK